MSEATGINSLHSDLMHVMLISTYELGHQPIHLASPAAALFAAGHSVTCVDLSVEELDPGELEAIDAVGFSVPMHTAMRLAIPTARRIRELDPELPIAFYGLYADVGKDRTFGVVTDAIFCGEYEPDLVSWVSGLPVSIGREVHINLGRSDFRLPRRAGLPPLEEYARLEHQGVARLAAAVEASHGCRHRCRHCPIPAVYDGRLRVVGQDLVVGDIDQLVRLGAEHITFSDADFLNAPAYSMDVLRAAHQRHPMLTYDVTVKVEHILQHRGLWPEMAELGVLFVVSAFESVDDRTLQILDKGHSIDDMVEAIQVIRSAGIHIRPTWLPFLPWTTPADIAGIFGFLDEHDLGSALDPVQLAIKVLVPEGSLLVDNSVMKPYLSHFDGDALTWMWSFVHSDSERLHKELDRIAAEASDCAEESEVTLESMRAVVSQISGVVLGPQPSLEKDVPRLSESWFCCAEPTAGQAISVDSITLSRKH